MEDANRGITRRTFLKWLGLGAVGTATTLTIPGETSIQSIEKEHQEIVRQKPAHVELHSPESTLTSAILKLEEIVTPTPEEATHLLKDVLMQIDSSDLPAEAQQIRVNILKAKRNSDGKLCDLSYYMQPDNKSGFISYSDNASKKTGDVDKAKTFLDDHILTPVSEILVSTASTYTDASPDEQVGWILFNDITLNLSKTGPQKIITETISIQNTNQGSDSSLQDGTQASFIKSDVYNGNPLKQAVTSFVKFQRDVMHPENQPTIDTATYGPDMKLTNSSSTNIDLPRDFQSWVNSFNGSKPQSI